MFFFETLITAKIEKQIDFFIEAKVVRKASLFYMRGSFNVYLAGINPKNQAKVIISVFCLFSPKRNLAVFCPSVLARPKNEKKFNVFSGIFFQNRSKKASESIYDMFLDTILDFKHIL